MVWEELVWGVILIWRRRANRFILREAEQAIGCLTLWRKKSPRLSLAEDPEKNGFIECR